jgi:hypothetical protein
VESPLETSAVEELRALTDLDIQLALASGAKIRELIRQVYARGSAADTEERQAPVQLAKAFAAALEAGAGQFGISTRGNRSRAWWNDAGTIRRRPLEGDWVQELNRILSPAPGSRVRGQTRAEWEAQLSRGGTVSAVGVMYLADESGHEYLFRPRPEEPRLTERFAPPSSGVLSEIRLLARSGSARFIVTTEPAELGHDILPHVPALVLDPTWRSIYVCTADSGAAREAFSLALAEDPDRWASELEALRAFHFDVVTVDLPSHRPDWAATALDVASVAFILWPADADTRPAHEAGIRWALRIAGEDHRLDWALEPLHP